MGVGAIPRCRPAGSWKRSSRLRGGRGPRSGVGARAAPPTWRRWGVGGVAGVVGATIGSLPGARAPAPTEAGVEVVVGVADAVELVEAGVAGVLVLGAPDVVVLDAGSGAPLDGADRELHSRAYCMAWVGPRVSEVTLRTSTPLVMTSLRTASPRRLLATSTGIGPSPVISQSSSPSTWPRHSASMSSRRSARCCGAAKLRFFASRRPRGWHRGGGRRSGGPSR